MADIRDIDGLWCDDITFCPERCGWKSCPRNSENIRDKTIPHSFSVEIPSDCPQKEVDKKMQRVFCDVCNKEMPNDFSETVALSFNAYGVVGFKVDIGGYKPNGDVHLCKACAEDVLVGLADLRKLRMPTGNGGNDNADGQA